MDERVLELVTQLGNHARDIRYADGEIEEWKKNINDLEVKISDAESRKVNAEEAIDEILNKLAKIKAEKA